jgi:asparagine synthetase B (glutamine-hydrolysing)
MSVLTPLEVASGLVFGLAPEQPESLRPDPAVSPLEALERAVLPALERSPCLVSFSGGRDSSAVLALAAGVARREGLPLPIPATNRFPGLEGSDETEWQERVVSHLGVSDWLRLDWTDELDCVGPFAAGVLRRHGLLWPFNSHFHAPLLEQAAGGSLLTGLGGDEFLSESSWSRQLDVVHGRVRPEARDVLRLGFLLAPRPLRRAALRRRVPLAYDWLRAEARRAVVTDWVAQAATEPVRWSRRARWTSRLRYLHTAAESLSRVAADDGVELVHPFLDPDFTAALAALPRRERFADRTGGMRALFGRLLPGAVIERESKAGFDGAFWTENSRTTAASWDGNGVDEEVVDCDALGREWAAERPDTRSFLLLQAVWLSQQEPLGDGVEQHVDRVRHRVPGLRAS